MALTNPQGPIYTVDFDGYNATGFLIPAGSAVRIEGVGTHVDLGYPLPLVELAQSNTLGDMPCNGISVGDIESGGTGTIRVFGLVEDLDTSAFSDGDALYVSGTVPGGLSASNDPPNIIEQRVGHVAFADATAGSIFVIIDPMIDGNNTYTSQGSFDIHNTAGTSATLSLGGTGGGVSLVATPTGVRTITVPDATDTLVGKATTDTLTNKKFTNAGGVHILDSDSSHDLIITTDSNLTANRTLLLKTGDFDRGLTIGASASVSGLNTGDQTITLTGDVTGTGSGSFAATIANNAVSMAKLADIASQTIIGRGDASSGDPSACTLETGIQVTTGEVFKAAGRWLRRTVYTSGSGTHTPGTDCNYQRVRAYGNGGGGGGADQAGSGQAGAAGGGAAGAKVEKFAAVSGTYSYDIPAAASGGSAGNNAGATGGDVTFTGTNFTLVAKGGLGGNGGASTATSNASQGGSGVIATGGDINGAGACGTNGAVISGSAGVAFGGVGGSGEFGRGGGGRVNHGAGTAAIGIGSGGGGAVAITASTPRAGGAGTAGAIIVDEYS